VWRDKLVVIGSSALANDLSDRGATPLQADTLLVSKHWNVASSVLTGRFIHKSTLYQDLLILALLVGFTGYITWQMRTSIASAIALLLIIAYISIAVSLYLNARIWIPIVLPLCGVILSFVSIMTWRVVVEQAERRRIRSLFSKMVSPKIVSELLATDTLALGGARRDITVFFADVRGFTELTDNAQQQVADYIERNKLTGAAAEACFDDQAKQTLATVNLYLGVVANTIISNYGTLDKFIGDCVMAFWGAPTPNPRHASSAIRAAIAAQRAVFDLNQEREAENSRRKLENTARSSKGAEPLPLLPILTLGSGLNSGPATAGLMGSEESESLSYTVFGREVNLASRLEGASGKGRIFISQPTYEHLLRDDPALASTCRALEPIAVKGFRAPVSIFEVPWRPAPEVHERLKGTGEENRKEMVGGQSV
jgi:adenylate cyclase